MVLEEAFEVAYLGVLEEAYPGVLEVAFQDDPEEDILEGEDLLVLVEGLEEQGKESSWGIVAIPLCGSRDRMERVVAVGDS
jgi:hypothetical protein